MKLKKRPTQSVLAEHRYATLAALAILLTVLGKAGGMTFGNALVISLWITSIIWLAWQLVSRNSERTPEPPPKQTNPVVLAPHGVKPQKAKPNQPGNRR